MSTIKLSQIWEEKNLDNTDLTIALVALLRSQNLVAKEIAGHLNIPTKRVHNWFYRDTGMTALDLLKMLQRYDFVRRVVGGLLPHRGSIDGGRE